MKRRELPSAMGTPELNRVFWSLRPGHDKIWQIVLYRVSADRWLGVRYWGRRCNYDRQGLSNKTWQEFATEAAARAWAAELIAQKTNPYDPDRGYFEIEPGTHGSYANPALVLVGQMEA